nr:hypothetical protein [Deltaproteobacteria bacterium]
VDGTSGPGAKGSLDQLRAPGFALAFAPGGAGGAGGPGNTIDGLIGSGGDLIDDGGGGGGAVGRIRIHTKSGSAAVTGVLSPGLTDANTTSTQGTVTLR